MPDRLFNTDLRSKVWRKYEEMTCSFKRKRNLDNVSYTAQLYAMKSMYVTWSNTGRFKHTPCPVIGWIAHRRRDHSCISLTIGPFIFDIICRDVTLPSLVTLCLFCYYRLIKKKYIQINTKKCPMTRSCDHWLL